MLFISERSIERVKKRFCEEGWEAVLQRKPSRRIYERKVDGEVEAHLVQLCCSEPPEGRIRWTLRLLAYKMVELKYVRSISHVTVREVLKKNCLKPWKTKEWIIPPEQNSALVARMEQVLDVYKQPYDPNFPVVCMDESPKQLIEIRNGTVPMKPGKEKRQDCDYIRHGMVNIFMAGEPLKGKRHVEVHEMKTKRD